MVRKPSPIADAATGIDKPPSFDTAEHNTTNDEVLAQVTTETTPDLAVCGPTLTIKGPAKGRWRAGRRFTPEAVFIPVADLTEDHLDALFTDPELIVVVN